MSQAWGHCATFRFEWSHDLGRSSIWDGSWQFPCPLPLPFRHRPAHIRQMTVGVKSWLPWTRCCCSCQIVAVPTALLPERRCCPHILENTTSSKLPNPHRSKSSMSPALCGRQILEAARSLRTPNSQRQQIPKNAKPSTMPHPRSLFWNMGQNIGISFRCLDKSP